MDTNGVLAAKNFLITYYRTGDITDAFNAADDFIDSTDDYREFLRNTIGFFSEGSSLSVHIMKDDIFVPLTSDMIWDTTLVSVCEIMEIMYNK
jgi:hypothetical protein